jgi:hypothetical protein
MRDAVHIVLILEDPRELPNDLLVLVLLHGELSLSTSMCQLVVSTGGGRARS